MRKQSGFTLIATIATIAIIMVLLVVSFKGMDTFSVSPSAAGGGGAPRADGKGGTVQGLMMARAKDEVCKSNLSQVRSALAMAKSSSGEDTFPSSLSSLQIGSDIAQCPVGKEAYVYDPNTGQVNCPHPGHQSY